jgi:hypothetical protein
LKSYCHQKLLWIWNSDYAFSWVRCYKRSVLWTFILPALKIMGLLSHNPFILCQSSALQSGPISRILLHRATHKPLIPVLQYRHERACSLEINLFGNFSKVTKRSLWSWLLQRNSILIDFQTKRDLWHPKATCYLCDILSLKYVEAASLSQWRKSLHHHYKVIELYFQHMKGTKIVMRDISLNTQELSSVRSPT